MKKLALLGTLLVFITGCETIKGIGRDIENTGEAIDRSVEAETADTGTAES